MKTLIIIGSFLYAITSHSQVSSPIVDSGQKICYNISSKISCPENNRPSVASPSRLIATPANAEFFRREPNAGFERFGKVKRVAETKLIGNIFQRPVGIE